MKLIANIGGLLTSPPPFISIAAVHVLLEYFPLVSSSATSRNGQAEHLKCVVTFCFVQGHLWKQAHIKLAGNTSAYYRERHVVIEDTTTTAFIQLGCSLNVLQN